MRLLIDLGNSRVKWATERDGALDGPFGFRRDAGAGFDAAWSQLEPAEVILCSVADAAATAALQDWLAARWNLRAHEVGALAQAGTVRSAYPEPAALGADRWANLLGARSLLGDSNAVIVDVGTAVTVDGLRADGRHIGGAIFPGWATMRSGLAQAAPALAAAAQYDHPGALPARETVAAVSGGTWAAFVGAVERVAADVAQELERPAFVLTGGDGAALAEALPGDWLHDPLLTMRGLLAARELACAG
jgi:type III pantothenate kinase